MLEVGGAGFFASVRMYSLQDDGLFASFGYEMDKEGKERVVKGSSSHVRRLFTHDCAKFKDMAHVNSFGYDFNVTSINNMLLKGVLPFGSFDFMKVLCHFLGMYPTLPRYSHNEVSRHKFMLKTWFEMPIRGMTNLKCSPRQLTEYLCFNPEDYGYKELRQINGKKVLFRTQSIMDGDVKRIVTLAMCPSLADDVDDQEVCIYYYVIISTPKQLFPKTVASSYPTARRMEIKELPSGNDTCRIVSIEGQAKDAEVVSASGYESIYNTMQNVLQDTVKEVRTHYHRDVLWKRLRSGDANINGCKLFAQQVHDLMRLVCCTPIEITDPQLESMLQLNVVWRDVVATFQKQFEDSVRLVVPEELSHLGITEKDYDRVQLIIFHPTERDVAMHLAYEARSRSVSVEVLIRACSAQQRLALIATERRGDEEEERTEDPFLLEVYRFIALIVNTHCKYLWQNL